MTARSRSPFGYRRFSVDWELGEGAEDALTLVGQYRGPRLPDGATTLPEGATIEWWHVVPMSPA